MQLSTPDATDWLNSMEASFPLSHREPGDARLGLDTKLIPALSKAVEELGLAWSALEEPAHSHLDELFLHRY